MFQAALERAHPQLAGKTELVTFITSGDRYHEQVLADIGGKGLFTKEIEEPLLAREIDLAVHSLKDMQTVLPEGLVLACTPEREDPRDVLIGASGLAQLPQGAKIGTSSLRRAALVKHARPDVMIVPFRGNVATRIEKLKRGDADVTLLAQAGLNRLQLQPDMIHAPLAVDQFLPAIAQGILAIECRDDDFKTRDVLAALNHAPTHAAAQCERAFLRALDGSCRTPIAGFAHLLERGELLFHGLVASPDGTRCETISGECGMADAALLGRSLGEEIRTRNGIAQMLGLC